MNKVNKIILTKRDFGSDEDLYKALAAQLKLLFQSGYQCVISDSDSKGGVICIEYAHSELAYGEAKPYWLSDLEAIEAKKLHDQIEVEQAKLKIKKEKKKEDNEFSIDAKIKEGGEA